MGDRAIAEIKTGDGSLYVYTHWGGGNLPNDARNAVLTARPRWGDEPYATRIIVDQLTRGGRDKEIGYGLMLQPCAEDEYNGNNPSVVIDLPNRTLWSVRYGTTEFTKLESMENIPKEGAESGRFLGSKEEL